MISRYRLEPIPDSSHQWRLLVLRPRKGSRGGKRYICIAIGTGRKNMLELERALKRYLA